MAKTVYIKVLIVDNHPLHILGLSSLLDDFQKFNIIGTADNCEDALKLTEKERPKLVIIEIKLGKENGMNIISKIKAISPDTSILILTVNEERFYSERVLRLGARGYVMKTAPKEKIIEAITTVLDGKVFLSENERERIFQAMTGENSRGSTDWAASYQKLSNRELQVFTLIGKGFGTIDIASKLNLSTKTVDTHKEHIKLKLHCTNSQELRQQAIEWSNYSDSL